MLGGLLLAPSPGSCSTGRPGCRDDARADTASAPTASCAASGAAARSRSKERRLVYRLAPAVIAAATAAAVLLVPAAELAPNWGVGHDALALAGLLALARLGRRGGCVGRGATASR